MRPGLLESLAAAGETAGPLPAPGGVIALRREGAEAGWDSFTFGHSDISLGTKNSAEAVWHAASLAKQFTAMVVIALCRQCRVPLRSPVSEWLPENWQGPPIALHHLLFHTSGLSDEAVAQLTDDPERLPAVCSQLARAGDPGREFRYASVNYSLLARVAERLSGWSFAEAVKTLVLEPAGMQGTAFSAGGDVTGYRLAETGWLADPQRPTVAGPEGIFLSLTELCRWHEALSSGCFDPADRLTFDSAGTLDDGSACGYGFGQYVYRYKGVPIFLHPARDRSVCSLYIRGPGEERGLIAMTNGNRPDLLGQCWQIMVDYYDL